MLREGSFLRDLIVLLINLYSTPEQNEIEMTSDFTLSIFGEMLKTLR